MIIAKNDEDKRSRVWNYVTGITTVLIIIVAGYFIYQGFFGNPLEGKWKHDESDMILEVDDHNEAELDWKNLIDGKVWRWNLDIHWISRQSRLHLL